MQEPDVSKLFPEITEGWLRRAVIAAWLDGYRTHRYEVRAATIEKLITKCDELASMAKQERNGA